MASRYWTMAGFESTRGRMRQDTALRAGFLVARHQCCLDIASSGRSVTVAVQCQRRTAMREHAASSTSVLTTR